jgi:glutamate-5-semialdehyde dehydrogenase
MEIKKLVLEIAQKAREASLVLPLLDSTRKNKALRTMAAALEKKGAAILRENRRDLQQAEEAGQPRAFLDRLRLTEKTLAEMAGGLREVALLPDPVGEVTGLGLRPNGLQVGRMRIPLGVIGFIYESRPNVTVDAAGLCLKSGNAVILKGGSEAIYSNRALARLLQEVLIREEIHPGAIQVIPTTDREATAELLQLEELIPRRGGPDPGRDRSVPHTGPQALQGGLPHLRRRGGRSGVGRGSLLQCQGAASRGLQRHGNPVGAPSGG